MKQLVILLSWAVAAVQGSLVFRDGAYSGLRVRVGEEAPVGECTQTLADLQRVVNLTSWAVHEVTGGRAWVRDVEVVVPRAWGRAACTPGGVPVGETSTSNAEIVVGSGGEVPLALQSGGCGEEGEHLHLPLPFLTSNTTHQAALLAREFARFRYGVFPETGFPDDPLYPATYSTGVRNITNTGCPGHLLCPTSDYDRLAPTKQNLLCGGRSALEVMLAGPDLREVAVMEGGRQVYTLLAAPRDPMFTYSRVGRTQYALVVDQDQPSHRWTHLKRALYQFIELLPEGSVLSVISTSSSASVLLPPTVITEAQREGLLGRIPRRGAEGVTQCLQCGVQLAVDTLGELGGTLVLVTGHSMAGIHLPTPPNTFLVSYREEGSPLGQLPGHVTVYSITGGAEKEQNPLVALTEAFIDVHNRVEREPVEKVHESGHLSHHFQGTFYIEESQTRDITISLYIDDEQKVEMFEVKDPTGRKNIFSKFGDGAVVFRLAGESRAGVWSFHARLYAEASLPPHEVAVTVVTRGEGVRARGLVRGSNLLASLSSSQGEPVVGGLVVATVSGPGGEAREVVLRDSGLGYPDTTRGDGLYTGGLGGGGAAGYRAVRLRVEATTEGALVARGGAQGDCCGSWRTTDTLGSPTGQFTRFLTSPSVYLEAGSTKDTIPPSRIPDLRILDTDTNSTTVELAWTAPGGDLDQGQADTYEIRCSTDPTELVANFSGGGIVMVETDSAGVFGSPERLVAGVPWAGQTFYYGVVAVDTAGNRGPVSNLVAAFIIEATTPRLALPLAQDEDLVGPSLGSSWLLDRNSVALAGGVVGGVILVIVILVIGLLVRARRSSKPEDKARGVLDTYEAGFYPDIKISASVSPKLEGSQEVYDWLEGSQGSSGSRPETAASTEESTASTGGEEESPPHHTSAPAPRHADTYSTTLPHLARVPPEVAPKPHGRSRSYLVPQVEARASMRHHRHPARSPRTQETPASHAAPAESCRRAPEVPLKKKRHESVV